MEVSTPCIPAARRPRVKRCPERGDQGYRSDDTISEAAASADLPGWFDEGLNGIIEALLAAPEDLEAFVFLNDAPAPRVLGPEAGARDDDP